MRAEGSERITFYEIKHRKPQPFLVEAFLVSMAYSRFFHIFAAK